jgi:cell division septation protein DedD
MSFTTALYGGDSVIHSMPRASVAVRTRVAGVKAKRAAQPATVLETAELATAELKGWTVLIGAIWNALRSAALWIDQKSMQAHYRRIDAYLSQATDHADLERRMRDMERRNQLNWIDCGSR